ncbi:hypothetical protein FPV67DRAFT_1654018 [Lyophyllum atratum]|nr:hypothetical protein FPV67DRAFT_1654018 [Lyophyllum atratum]
MLPAAWVFVTIISAFAARCGIFVYDHEPSELWDHALSTLEFCRERTQRFLIGGTVEEIIGGTLKELIGGPMQEVAELRQAVGGMKNLLQDRTPTTLVIAVVNLTSESSRSDECSARPSGLYIPTGAFAYVYSAISLPLVLISILLLVAAFTVIQRFNSSSAPGAVAGMDDSDEGKPLTESESASASTGIIDLDGAIAHLPRRSLPSDIDQVAAGDLVEVENAESSNGRYRSTNHTNAEASTSGSASTSSSTSSAVQTGSTAAIAPFASGTEITDDTSEIPSLPAPDAADSLPEWYVAHHDYTGHNYSNRRLSFLVGHLIRVTGRDPDNTWWHGEIAYSGERRWFCDWVNEEEGCGGARKVERWLDLPTYGIWDRTGHDLHRHSTTITVHRHYTTITVHLHILYLLDLYTIIISVHPTALAAAETRFLQKRAGGYEDVMDLIVGSMAWSHFWTHTCAVLFQIFYFAPASPPTH